MAKQSQFFRYYKSRLERCKDGDELVKLSREIESKSFPPGEKLALQLSAIFIAKQFDKKGKQLKEAAPEGGDLDG